MPFVILLFAELVLRISGFGQSYPLFIDVQKQELSAYLQPNPKVINRYFTDEQIAPKVSPDTVYFKKYKAPSTFRIFVQGGSTAAGFPYGRWGSLQGMLTQRFKRLYPDKNIEIINTAMAAVNSYTLLDFVDEIIEQKPDLVLIYAGHNEYLGIMGVGSSFASKGGRIATLLHLKFKNWRLYQLMQKLYFVVSSTESNQRQKQIQNNKSLMSQVAKEKEIHLDSDLFHQGIDQFKGNMGLILQKYQAAGVQVLLGNLVSNESGQVPFSSIGKVDWRSYKASITRDNVTQESIAQEISRLKELLVIEKNAETYFKLALNLQKANEVQQAKDAFVLAKDFDLLRFRAPSEFNVVIANLAKKYGALLVDVQTRFSEKSPQNIINNDLILEHLHPTVDGYFLLAESYADIINEKKLLAVSAQPYVSSKARYDVPISIVDQFYGEFIIRNLMNDYPFIVANESNNKKIALPVMPLYEKQALIERIEKKSWINIQKKLLVKYQQNNNIEEAAKIAGLISVAMVVNHKASYISGQLYQQLNDWQLASYYHHRAVLLQPKKVSYLLALAQDYFLMKNYERSLIFLERANEATLKWSPQKQKILNYIKNAKAGLTATTRNHEKS